MPRRVLTREDVELIRSAQEYRRELRAQGLTRDAMLLSNTKLADKFGCSTSAIKHVLAYRNWC